MHHKNQRFVILFLFMLLFSLIQAPAGVQGFAGRGQDPQILSPSAAAFNDSQGEGEDYKESGQDTQGLNRYIVLLKSPLKSIQRQAAIQRAVAASGGRVKAFYSAAINGYSAELPPAALEELRTNPDVALIEPDYFFSISDGWPGASLDVGSGSQSDPVWNLDRIDQRDLPLDQTFTYDTVAGDVHVYVVDTGLRASHEEFTGRVGDGFSAMADGRGTSDCNGHGTHVAGTIAGSIYGVAKSATVHPVRVLDCEGEGFVSGILDGLDWIIENGLSPGVVNLSLGGTISTSLDQAVNNVIDAGFTVVAAAGNTGSDACQVSPARVPAAITVGATDSSDTRPPFSNVGICLDLFAPGTSIKSAYPTSDSSYQLFSGTSMAAPHVAGVAALYLQATPEASPKSVAEFIRDSSTLGKVKDLASGSPNRLLFVDSGPTPLEPTGSVFSDLKTFEWARVEGATLYQLELFEGESTEPVEAKEFKDSVCNETRCSFDPEFLLDVSVGGYQWRVQAYLDEGWGDWTDRVSFSVVTRNEIFFPILVSN